MVMKEGLVSQVDSTGNTSAQSLARRAVGGSMQALFNAFAQAHATWRSRTNTMKPKNHKRFVLGIRWYSRLRRNRQSPPTQPSGQNPLGQAVSRLEIFGG
jgi:hypothetical protein